MLAETTSQKPSPSSSPEPASKVAPVYGETDETASNVITKKTTAADFNATIATAMGLQYNQTIMSPSKRPFRIGGEEGEPIHEILT